MQSAKILTTEKLHILSDFLGEDIRKSHAISDYFYLGEPLLDPPTLRGSMVIVLKTQFLADNRDFIVYGSPVDTGAVRFGFIKPSIDCSRFLELIQCDADKFVALVKAISGLSTEARRAVATHQPHESLSDILDHFFGVETRQIMFELGDSPHVWLFEYALKPGYRLSSEHISAIWYPNTYQNTDTFITLSRKLNGRLKRYNPKYGIEACRE